MTYLNFFLFLKNNLINDVDDHNRSRVKLYMYIYRLDNYILYTYVFVHSSERDLEREERG